MYTNITLVGLSGKKYSGKDTFCKALADSTNIPVMRIALADPLKDEVYEYILKPNNILRTSLDDHNKGNFRLMLQAWGTDFRRNLFGTDYWVLKLDSKIKELHDSGFKGIVVITDVRFLDEANYVQKCNGYVVRIHRFQKKWWQNLFSRTKEDNHPSECALDDYDFDYHVYNYKDIEDLKHPAKEFLSLITPQITHGPLKTTVS